MNCLFTCSSRSFNLLRSKTLFQIFLFLGLLIPFSNVNAQGQLLDIDVNLVRVAWGGDVFCGDGEFTDPTGCVTAAGGPDIRYKYRIGYAGGNYSSYKYIGANNSPTSGGPTLDNQSNTDGNSNFGSNFDVSLVNVCGSVTFDVEAWEEDVSDICAPFGNLNYDYQSNYTVAGICNTNIFDNSDDIHRTGVSNAPISANTNLSWEVNLGSGDYIMNFSLLATRVAAPTLVSGTTTICSGGSTTLTSSSAESGTVIRWYTNPSNPNGSVVGDGNSITVSPSATTTYYFAQYKNDCIGLSRAQTVTVVADPTAPSITRNTTSSTVCQGTSLTVNTSGGSGGTGTCNNQYRYSTNGGSNYTNWSTTVPSFSAVTGTNIVQSRRNCNGSGCGSNVNSVTWTVEANPGPQTVNATTCNQNQAGTVVTTETNAAGCSYQVTTITTWVGQANETVNVTSCNQADAGTVTTTQTNAAGCTYQLTTVTTWIGQADETIQATSCNQADAGSVSVQQTNAAGCTYNVTTVTTWIGQADETVNLTTCNEAEAGTVVTIETNTAGCTYQRTTVTTWVGQDDETLEVITCDPNEVGTVVTTETNAAGCTYELTTITILETVLPTAQCQDVTVELDASGNGTLTADAVDNGSSDNCSIAITTIGGALSLSFGCSDVGIQSDVEFVVEDVAGNVSLPCLFDITIVDNVLPTALCQAVTVELDASGNASTSASAINNGSSDACGIANLTLDNSSFTCSDVGANTVTLTVTDANGNQSTCTTSVTVEDNEDLTLICPSNVSIQTSAGICGAVYTWDDPVATDNCGVFAGTSLLANGIPTLTLSSTSGGTGNRSGLAYNPNSNRYYSVNAGNGSYPIECFDGSTGILVNSTSSGFDYRGAWWNPATNQAEGNGYSSLGVVRTLLSGDCPSGSVSSIMGANQPTVQSCGDLDYDNNEIIYYNAGSITRVNRNTGATIGVLALAGNPSCLYASNSVGYTGIIGYEYVLYCVSTGEAHLFDRSTGAYAGKSSIGLNTTSYGFAYENGQAWVYTGAAWNGFNIFGGGSLTTIQTGGPISGSTLPVGISTISYEVSDGLGNSDNCSFTVEVIDNEAPTAVCQDITVYLGSNGTVSIDKSDIENGSTDNCGSTNALSIDIADFDCSNIGSNTVTLLVEDDNGNQNSCTSIVTVVDTIAPTLVCPASFTVNTDEGICGALIDATLLAPITASDNCLASLEYSYAGNPIGLLPTYFGSGSGELPSVTVYTGSADFSYEMSDSSGNSSSCSFTVTVNDLEPPVLTCPDDITVFTDPGVCGAVVEYVVTFSDNCPSQTKLVLTGGLGSASLFPTGTSTESYGYSDYSGNGTACSFTITVIDNELPVLECPDDITVDTDPGICAAFIAGSLTAPVTASDNCASNLEYTLSGNPYGLLPTYFDQGYGNLGDVSISGGNAVVEYTLTDASGNSVNCSFTITVNDNELPVVTCPSDITVDTDPGECSAVINYAIGLSENCPIFNFPPKNAPQLVSGLGSGEAFPVGSTVNTYSFTDVQGNTNSCSFTITVEDNVPPTAVCQDVTVYLDANGNGSTSPSLVDDGSNDACGIADLALDNEDFYCEDVTGTNVVTLTVTDNNGNSSTCTSNVTVVGVLPDVYITEAPLPEFCQGGTIVLTANSDEAIAYAWDTNPIQTTQSIEIDANGTYTVTVTSATGCTEQASYTISDFDAGALLSSYSIIGLDEVHLHNENIVYSGGVGVVNENKKAKLHDNSFVYTFIQAPKIEIDGSSAAANTILAQANVILPAFVTNPYDSNNDVKVNKNTTVVLTDCIYDKVEIDKEATVTFTCDNIYIHELKTKEGVTIKFDGAANLFINKKVKLEKYTKFNPDGLPVRAYIDDKLEVKEGSDVFANVYASKDINAKGKDKDEAGTNMTGIFIGEKVHGHEAVNWYWNTDCDLLPLPILPAFTKISDGVKDIDNNLVNKIQSAVYPNPFMDKATIEFTVPESNLTSIEIMTIDGKVIQVIELGLLDANTRQLVDFVPEFNQKAGMLIYRIVSGNNYATGNMIFIK